MSRVCEVTGKRPMKGNHVSHANNKVKRTFTPNLRIRRLWIPSQNRWIKMKISCRALRTIDKKGIENVLSELSEVRGS